MYQTKLHREQPINNSGTIYHDSAILHLKESHYCIIPISLDGDAPKSFVKAYFYEPKSRIRRVNIKSWKSYIVKTAEKWYPHESIIEYMINRFGQSMGLNINNVKLRKINGQIRFLSEYFLDSKHESLVHGAEICGAYLEDNELAKKIANDKDSSRELFTIEFIMDAIKSVFHDSSEDLCKEFIKMIVYDAIIGNNDRHFYNWGVINQISSEHRRPIFSPIYDTARGLLWNWSDENIINLVNNDKRKNHEIDKYIGKASPRISIEGNSKVNHFELITHIWKSYEKYQGTITSLTTFKVQQQILKTFKNEFEQFFIPERNELIELIIGKRFHKLRKIVSSDDN